jgi:RimJ/RimL family protein N-acetyltransferase
VVGDLPDLTGFFAQHDLQIGSGGTAAWERCCIGAPTLAVRIAENQLAVLPQLAQRGAVEWPQPDRDWDEEAFALAIRELIGDPRRRLALARQARGLVDGKGSGRVAAVIALAAKPDLGFREAQPADELLLLSWANDPLVRENAFNPAAISPEHHRAWFQARLERPQDCCIVIATSCANMPVGQVRFERGAEGWLIGYSLDAAFRGWNHGGRLLSGAIEVLRARFGAVGLQAMVKPENTASLRTFRALGFRERMLDRQGTACYCFELTGT